MEEKTVTDWARDYGVIPNTARIIRTKVEVGRKTGRVWMLTKADWEVVLGNLHVGPGRPRNDFKPSLRKRS